MKGILYNLNYSGKSAVYNQKRKETSTNCDRVIALLFYCFVGVEFLSIVHSYVAQMHIIINVKIFKKQYRYNNIGVGLGESMQIIILFLSC